MKVPPTIVCVCVIYPFEYFFGIESNAALNRNPVPTLTINPSRSV